MSGTLRYFSYVLLVAALAAAMLPAAMWLPGGLQLTTPVAGTAVTTSEFSVVEHLQNALILLCVSIFAWIASRDRLRRPLAIAFISLLLLFLIRELDFFLDYYLVDNLWQVLAGLVIAVAGVYLLRHRRQVRAGWRRSWPSGGLEIIFAGLLILLPFAQLVATDALWQTILGDDYVRTAKLAIEEFVELGGYALITVGSLEFLHGWSRLPRTRTIDPPRRRQHRH